MSVSDQIKRIKNELVEQKDLITQITIAVNDLPDINDKIELPELENPASANEILNGYQAIDGDGNLITGTLYQSGDSGGSVETCTLNIDSTATGGCQAVIYTVYENNTIVGKVIGDLYDLQTYTTIALENIVCGSAVFVFRGAGSIHYATIPSDVSVIDDYSGNVIICAPTTPNTNATIIFNNYID